MDRKFLFVLLATIFYNGVTYSSPIEGQVIPDVRPPEEKPPTVPPTTVDHINKKIEPTPVPAANSTVVPVSQKVPPQHTETTDKNVAVHSATENLNLPHINLNHTSDNKNQTNEKKSPTVPQTNGDKTVQPVANTNATAPADQPAGKNSKEMPIPAPGSQDAAVSVTPAQPKATTKISTSTPAKATTAPISTTVKPTAANSTISTVPPPISTTKDSGLAVQNTPAPAQEKHFDGASFVGGIVLTIGLTAIGFIAFKYYKSGKIDMSYRTL